MSDTSDGRESQNFGELHRWELTEFYLRRSENAANLLRAMLFALSGGAIGFVANQNYAKPTGFHAFSIVAFAIAIGMIVFSWHVQKGKAIERFKKLRDEGYTAFRQQEEYYARHRRNYVIDLCACAFIIIGFLIEFVPIVAQGIRK
jgi:hypothetical protein